MARYQFLTAIATALIVIGMAPAAQAQFRNYNNPGTRLGTPGFSRPIFMPDRRNSYSGNQYRGNSHGYGYGRHRRGNEDLTIINGGNNCINCQVDGWGRRDQRGNVNWNNQHRRGIYFYY